MTPVSPTASASPPPSATIAFPTIIPSPTWTPEASRTPIADPRPDLGPVLFRDGFDDPDLWALSSSSDGGAGIHEGVLTLAIRSPRVFRFTQRQPPGAGDFYAEVELFTEVCSAGDEFGLVARTNSLGEHYRFVIGCDGKARISRALEAGSRALTLWTASPAIIPGAPARNRLGVLADGLDLTLFVNGTAVVAARDAALTEGTFGLMARAGPAGQVAASFDDLVVRSLADPLATTTPAGTPPP